MALSLRVSGIALLFSTLIGVPVGAALGLSRFVGRKLLVAFMYTGMGFPPVVIGLFVYLLLSRSMVRIATMQSTVATVRPTVKPIIRRTAASRAAPVSTKEVTSRHLVSSS